MVPVSAISQIIERPDPGYASVYRFDASDALKIRLNGSSRGLGSLVVSAEAVTLDIDDPSNIDEVENRLLGLNLGFEVWDSGRGFHVVIPHEYIKDCRLPYSHRRWVESLNLPVDYSLYQHARILRLPNTVNTKTGRRKKLIKKVDGMQPKIELIDPPSFAFKPGGGLKTIASVLNQFQRLAVSEPLPGNRHTQLWSAARAASEAGLSSSATLEVLQEINSSWENPKQAEEVEKAVTQAYKLTEKSEQG
jgi:hypothetical protein